MSNRQVLLVDDEKAILSRLASRIRREGYEVLTAENGAEAWKVFQGNRFLVVVTDLMMPLKGGLEILQDIKKSSPATRVIVMTGLGKDHAIQALNSHAFFWVQKGGADTSQKLLQAIEMAFAEAESQIRAEREMLSFLTHTLFSTISGGPKTIEQVLKFAQSALGDKYREHDVYRMFNNIMSLNTIFMSIENMLNAYKIFVNEPDTFREKWQEERPGIVSMTALIATVLKQTLGSLLFEEGNVEQLNRILKAQQESSLPTARETFLKEVFWSDDSSHGITRAREWLAQNLPIMQLNIQVASPFLDAGGVRYPFLFAILGEILYNALKYTDCRQPIRVEWRKDSDAHIFSCSNTFSQASTRKRGSQKGLAFMNNLTQMINGVNLEHKSESELFSVNLRFRNDALDSGGA